MMIFTHSFARFVIFATFPALFLACGGGGEELNSSSDTESTDATDVGNTDGDVEDEDTAPNYAFSEEDFYQCSEDSDCGEVGGHTQNCVNNVCVIPPNSSACLAEETIPDETVVTYCLETDSQILTPERSCYDPTSADYIYLESEGPEMTALSGIVDRFGSGSTTYGLCVAAYNEAMVLPYLVNLECNNFDQDRDEDEFIACFQLDTCRCEDFFNGQDANQEFIDAAAEAWGEDIDDLDACYTFLGYCDGVEDDTAKTACKERVHSMTIAQMSPEDAAKIAYQDSVIFAHTRSFRDPDAPIDAEEEQEAGLYELASIPTNTMLTFKVSGIERRWRDTWEYGLFVRADLVIEDHFTLDTNAIADAGWRTIPPAVGLTTSIPDTHGAIAGSVRDCGTADRDPLNIMHATVGLSFEPRVLAYFNGNPANTLPDPSRADTNRLATYAGIDLPPGINRVSPIILTEDGAISAGGRNVFQTPKSLIIATFEGNYAQVSEEE